LSTLLPMGNEQMSPIQRKKPLILVADDEADILALVAYRLKQDGYEVVQANDGDEAVELARELIPDLAVVDVMMPFTDGYEVTESLRAAKETERVPVILLTARIQDADVKRGEEAGADAYIKKPFSPDELKTSVAALLAKSAETAPATA
jgi:DNA-binding response OmpR family regulator